MGVGVVMSVSVNECEHVMFVGEAGCGVDFQHLPGGDAVDDGLVEFLDARGLGCGRHREPSFDYGQTPCCGAKQS